MLKFVLFAVLFLDCDFGSTFDCSGKKNGNYPDPIGCNFYWSCVSGIAYKMPCPEHLYYDHCSGVCNYQDKVCGHCSITTKLYSAQLKNDPGYNNKGTFDCFGKKDGNYPDPVKCDFFWSCVAGKHAYKMYCPKGLYYDSCKNICNWPSQTCGHCGTTPSNNPPSNPTQNPPGDFDCSGKEDGNYPDPVGCTFYWACVAETHAYKMPCPNGLFYDSCKDICNWPSKTCGHCGPATTTFKAFTNSFPKTLTTKPQPSFDCSGKEDGNYPDPVGCDFFWSCVAGTYAYKMDCPKGLYYDSCKDCCNWPSETCGHCGTAPTNAPITVPTKRTTTKNPSGDFDCSGKKDGNYPDPVGCTFYWACVAETYAYKMPCPSGLLYDSCKDICNWPSETCGHCGPATTTFKALTKSSPKITPTKSKPSFDCSGKEDGNYPDPVKCDFFWSCVAGTYAYKMDCPKGLYYDSCKDICNWPSETCGHCGTAPPNEPISIPTKTTTTKNPSGDFDCSGKKDGNYPDPVGCTFYWACVAETYAYKMPCPSGLFYDSCKDICNWPKETCGHCGTNC